MAPSRSGQAQNTNIGNKTRSRRVFKCGGGGKEGLQAKIDDDTCASCEIMREGVGWSVTEREKQGVEVGCEICA